MFSENLWDVLLFGRKKKKKASAALNQDNLLTEQPYNPDSHQICLDVENGTLNLQNVKKSLFRSYTAATNYRQKNTILTLKWEAIKITTDDFILGKIKSNSLSIFCVQSGCMESNTLTETRKTNLCLFLDFIVVHAFVQFVLKKDNLTASLDAKATLHENMKT